PVFLLGTRRFRSTKSVFVTVLPSMNCARKRTTRATMWPRGVGALFQPCVVEQTREERAHILRLIEMAVDADGAATDREGQPVHVGHDREHGLIGNVVANEDRTAPFEGLMLHQF